MDKLTKILVVIISALSHVLEALFLGAYLGIVLCTVLSILEIFSTQRWGALPVLVVIIAIFPFSSSLTAYERAVQSVFWLA